MSLLKSLAWAAGGVAAVVAAPVTGGGSLALLIGAAGTTTAAGVALGAAGGAVVKAIYDEVTDDRDEQIQKAKNDAQVNKAGWVASEQKRNEDNAENKEKIKSLEELLKSLLIKHAAALEELKKYKLSGIEAELMFTLASAAAYADGDSSSIEKEAAIKAVSLLCANPKEAIAIGTNILNNKITIDAAIKRVKFETDINVLNRLSFILDVVVNADNYITTSEQTLLGEFNEHMKSVSAA